MTTETCCKGQQRAVQGDQQNDEQVPGGDLKDHMPVYDGKEGPFIGRSQNSFDP